MWEKQLTKFNSPEKPAAKWKRGDSVEITWHKNNHIGGFYRRSLVPVKHMMDRDWHQKAAFEWGCWSQGTFQCGQSDKCGGDNKNRAYKNQMTVPTVFPDGDYVFAQVWYGGLHWQGKKPKYSDYYACSFVRVEGGPLTSTYKSIFTPGAKKRNIPAGVCATGSVRTNECGGEACESGPVKETKPAEFQNGDGPTLRLSTFGGDEMKHGKVEPEKPTVETKQAVEEQKKDKRADEKSAREEENSTEQNQLGTRKGKEQKQDPSPTPTPTTTPKPRGQEKSKKGEKKNNKGNRKQNYPRYRRRSCGSIPPKPRGTWGKKYSALWWKQRNLFVARREYCRRCAC